MNAETKIVIALSTVAIFGLITYYFNVCSDLNYKYNSTYWKLNDCQFYLKECRYDKDYWHSAALSWMRGFKDINANYEILRQFTLLHDQFVTYFVWYNDVNNCTDFVKNYYSALDCAQKYRDFVSEHGETLEKLLNDDFAKSLGLEHGFQSHEELYYADVLIKRLKDTYNDCLKKGYIN